MHTPNESTKSTTQKTVSSLYLDMPILDSVSCPTEDLDEDLDEDLTG